jgi:hypothetical protein
MKKRLDIGTKIEYTVYVSERDKDFPRRKKWTGITYGISQAILMQTSGSLKKKVAVGTQKQKHGKSEPVEMVGRKQCGS